MDYKPKSILLTGGAGFIGSNVLCHLVKKYPKVSFVCLDKLSYCGTPKNFQEISNHSNFTFIQGNICSKDLLNHIFSSQKIDTIMHFAAETHVDNSFANSINFTQSNVLGTHMLLEMTRAYAGQIKRFIHVSTDEVYGESTMEGLAKQAGAALDPTNPYAATKAGAEFMVRSYRHSFRLPTIITRGNNVYGPKQYPEKLIPKFIHLLNQDKPCPLHGDGSSMRSFLYVGDVANAFDIVLHKGKVGEIYNVGTHFEISNYDVLQTLIKHFGKEKEAEKYISYVKDRAFNDFRYHINSTTLEDLGWSRKVDFVEGLALTKDWYLKNPDWFGDISGALAAHPGVGTAPHLLEFVSVPQTPDVKEESETASEEKVEIVDNGNERSKKRIKTQ